jgi:hypothetical protein
MAWLSFDPFQLLLALVPTQHPSMAGGRRYTGSGKISYDEIKLRSHSM